MSKCIVCQNVSSFEVKQIFDLDFIKVETKTEMCLVSIRLFHSVQKDKMGLTANKDSTQVST